MLCRSVVSLRKATKFTTVTVIFPYRLHKNILYRHILILVNPQKKHPLYNCYNFSQICPNILLPLMHKSGNCYPRLVKYYIVHIRRLCPDLFGG